MMLNDSVPERFRMSTLEMAIATDRFHCLSKRELLKATYRAWAVIGQPKPRGTILPPLCEVELRMERLIRAVNDVVGHISRGNLSNEREIVTMLGVALKR